MTALPHRLFQILYYVALLSLSPAGAGNTAAAAGAAVAGGAWIEVSSLEAFRETASQSGVRVRLKPGTYRLDRADGRHFLRFTGAESRYVLEGVRLEIDTELYRRFGTGGGVDGYYCAILIAGEGIVFEGGTYVTVGNRPGIQGRNKIFSIVGNKVTLRDVELTTQGSSPWGYGSLFGIAGGDVRKMNGIRVGWPARDVVLRNCRVHMRAMGHAIFVQGADRTLIEDCHVDGLLRSTDEILAERAGYAWERGFRTKGSGYLEGVRVGEDGSILPGEMIACSEDGIRMYDKGGAGHPTGSSTIRNCTVTRMRRGICTGLSVAPDHILGCEVRECVAAGFNAGNGDRLENCRADARYSEALCLPYPNARNASAALEILDSRGGLAGIPLAIVNGHGHAITLRTADPAFVPPDRTIQLGSSDGYAFYQRDRIISDGHRIRNDTPARLVDLTGK